MSNNSIRKAAVLIGLSIAMGGLSGANAATTCTVEGAQSQNPAAKIELLFSSTDDMTDVCDANDGTTSLVTDASRSASDTMSSSSSSAQSDPSSGTVTNMDFFPSSSMGSGFTPTFAIINPQPPVNSGPFGPSGFFDIVQGGATPAGSTGGGKTGDTASSEGGGNGSGNTGGAANGSGGGQGGGGATSSDAGGTASGKAGGTGSGKPGGDPVLTSLTSLSVASTLDESGKAMVQGLRSGADPISTSATPLPAALPLFAAGIGGLGLLYWCRKRNVRAVAVA